MLFRTDTTTWAGVGPKIRKTLNLDHVILSEKHDDDIGSTVVTLVDGTQLILGLPLVDFDRLWGEAKGKVPGPNQKPSIDVQQERVAREDPEAGEPVKKRGPGRPRKHPLPESDGGSQ